LAKSGSLVPILPAPGQQAPVPLPIQAKSIRGEYLHFRPAGSPPEGKRWPLMLFLHGIGESAVHPRTGERKDIWAVATHGPPSIVAQRSGLPFIVVSPQHLQAPYEWKVDELTQLIDYFAARADVYGADLGHVVIAGISMGADGAWALATTTRARSTWRIVALVLASPTSADPSRAARMPGVPVWIHYGEEERPSHAACAKELVGSTGAQLTHVPGGHGGPTWAALFEESHPNCRGFWAWVSRAGGQ
jgi:predicted peptidase